MKLALNRPVMTHDLMKMAQRELSAFFSAVTELFWIGTDGDISGRLVA